MTRKKRASKPRSVQVDLAKDLWISPHLSLRGRDGNRAWDRGSNLLPGAGARFLELADIALGTKKSGGQKKKQASTTVRQTTKDEPYLRSGDS